MKIFQTEFRFGSLPRKRKKRHGVSEEQQLRIRRNAIIQKKRRNERRKKEKKRRDERKKNQANQQRRVRIKRPTKNMKRRETFTKLVIAPSRDKVAGILAEEYRYEKKGKGVFIIKITEIT